MKTVCELFPATTHGAQTCWHRANPFATLFVAESAAIEGQTIAFAQVKQAVHYQAYQSMIDLADARRAFESLPDHTDKDIWTDALEQRDLKNWQAMIGREQHLWGDRRLPMDILGQYREYDIEIGTRDGGARSIGANWRDVPEKMNDLWDLVVQPDGGYGTGYVHGKRWQNWERIEQAAIIHHFYERIHPFGDGNGRSGRLLALYFLRMNDVPPVLFTNWDKAETYYPCFEEKQPDRMIEYFKSHQVESWQ